MQWTKEGAAELERLAEVVRGGYGGTLPGGNIVDRREQPGALPVRKNTMLGVPEPKSVEGEKK